MGKLIKIRLIFHVSSIQNNINDYLDDRKGEVIC